MPKDKSSKRRKEASSSESDSDSGPDDRNTKQPKKETKSASQGTNEWLLGRTRYAKLTEFKGKWFVDIREFYDAGGEMKPGRKGIMLQLDQWRKLVEAVDDIDAAIKKHV